MISVATKKERLGTCISGVKPAAENLKMLQNCKTIRGFTPEIKTYLQYLWKKVALWFKS